MAGDGEDAYTKKGNMQANCNWNMMENEKGCQYDPEDKQPTQEPRSRPRPHWMTKMLEVVNMEIRAIKSNVALDDTHGCRFRPPIPHSLPAAPPYPRLLLPLCRLRRAIRHHVANSAPTSAPTTVTAKVSARRCRRCHRRPCPIPLVSRDS